MRTGKWGGRKGEGREEEKEEEPNKRTPTQTKKKDRKMKQGEGGSFTGAGARTRVGCRRSSGNRKKMRTRRRVHVGTRGVGGLQAGKIFQQTHHRKLHNVHQSSDYRSCASLKIQARCCFQKNCDVSVIECLICRFLPACRNHQIVSFPVLMFVFEQPCYNIGLVCSETKNL